MRKVAASAFELLNYLHTLTKQQMQVAEGKRQVNNETELERILLRALWIWSKLLCWWIFVMLYKNVLFRCFVYYSVFSSLQSHIFTSWQSRCLCVVGCGCSAEKLEPAALMGRLGDADWHIRLVLSVVFSVSSPAPASVSLRRAFSSVNGPAAPNFLVIAV